MVFPKWTGTYDSRVWHPLVLELRMHVPRASESTDVLSLRGRYIEVPHFMAILMGNGMFHPSPEVYWLKRHPLEMNDFLMNQAASMLCMCGSPSCLRKVSTSGSKCPQLGRGSWCKMMFLDSWCPLSLPPTQTWYCDWIGLRETLQETIVVPIKYGAFL
jgi:hypothetical protein